MASLPRATFLFSARQDALAFLLPALVPLLLCPILDGAGVLAGKVPPLANSLGYFTHLPAGREYVMRVPGASNSALSDQDLADVLNWVLTTMNRDALPRDFKPYTAAEVAAHRRPAEGYRPGHLSCRLSHGKRRIRGARDQHHRARPGRLP